MTTATRRAVLAVVTIVVLVALGAGLGLVVGDALGIRTEPATQMQPAAPVVPASTAVVPAPEFTRIDAPPTVRVDVALEDLADAAADASETEGAASLTVVAGAGDDADETYRLTGTADALRIEAASETGAVRGIYDLAAQVRAGRSVAEHLGEEVTSRLPFRMVDMGAVAVTPDPAEWEEGDDYSHASKAFADVLLPDPPYIDPESLSDAYDDFDVFIRHSLANGYNAVAFPGLVEYLTFDDAPDGPVYAEGDDHRAKALALREAFAPFWARADELGMKVFLRTDMLTLTTPLEQYLTGRFGSLDTANPELWDVYAAGLDELYAAEPSLDGVLIRIGEAGRVYDVEGWDVYSALAVTSVDSVRTMLETLTAQAETADREVIFRTWSVGVGRGGRHAHERCVLRGRARRHRLAGAHRVDQVHAGRLLQLAAAERHPRAGSAAADRRVPESPRVRELRCVPQRPGARVPVRPPEAPRREREHRGRVDVDPGRRAVARRADDPVPEGRVLAAVRAEHDARRRPRARPVRRRRAHHRGLGTPVVLGRPGDGRGDRAGDVALAPGDRAGHVHRAVRRAAGLRDRARAAADDVDLRVGHPHRRLRRARRHLRDLARCHRRRHRAGDRGW